MLKQTLGATLLALVLGGCVPPEPCSQEAVAQEVAACVVRVRTECKPTKDGKKDTTCPAYVECRDKIDQWEKCE